MTTDVRAIGLKSVLVEGEYIFGTRMIINLFHSAGTVQQSSDFWKMGHHAADSSKGHFLTGKQVSHLAL